MAFQENYECISLPAAADLSSTGIYRFGVVDSNGRIALVAAAGGDGDGIVQNNPEQYEACDLAFSGVAKVYVGTGGVTAGNKVQSDANGAAIAATTGDHVLGKALATVAAGGLCPVLLVSKHIIA